MSTATSTATRTVTFWNLERGMCAGMIIQASNGVNTGMDSKAGVVLDLGASWKADSNIGTKIGLGTRLMQMKMS